MWNWVGAWKVVFVDVFKNDSVWRESFIVDFVVGFFDEFFNERFCFPVGDEFSKRE